MVSPGRIKKFIMANNKSRYININLGFMNNSLSVTEVALLTLIKGLSKKKGYCYASNKSICQTLNLSDRTLFRLLSKLESDGYINRQTKSTGHYGKERRIHLSPGAEMAEYII